MIEAIHFILAHLSDERMEQLSQPEKVIIIPYLQQASRYSQKFTEDISHLQISKPSHEHEKCTVRKYSHHPARAGLVDPQDIPRTRCVERTYSSYTGLQRRHTGCHPCLLYTS